MLCFKTTDDCSNQILMVIDNDGTVLFYRNKQLNDKPLSLFTKQQIKAVIKEKNKTTVDCICEASFMLFLCEIEPEKHNFPKQVVDSYIDLYGIHPSQEN